MNTEENKIKEVKETKKARESKN
jgi:hypothetical protein